MKGEGDDSARFPNLANAARVSIAERGEAIEAILPHTKELP